MKLLASLEHQLFLYIQSQLNITMSGTHYSISAFIKYNKMT